MTTLQNRPNTAVLVVDVQNGVMARAHNRDAVVGNLARLVDRAREAGAPVIWVQHINDNLVKDADPWRIVPELTPAPTEPNISKRYGDAFEDTDLEARLAALAVGRLIVAGAQTDACIRATIHGAFARGYDVTLASDAHSTEDLSQWGAPPPEQVIAHTNLYWRFQTGPGRVAEVAESEKVAFPASA
ncbi:nicotinamidase-related amidase [Caulobacter ginsengisoli]|uniref:Nicotinamidase-related amidase n=1 Tax=Caulobacter ginsengisoli TaxID=400775 RepID=A0ABU0IVG8_9CAUL|nr:cysteine hydrolase family protein [Caulobacter ginsengisoli]MDQ0466017.1 nicotinamidase-related amidase [Caulobacter ginsengisoli]